jgi:hypothetical protein
MLENARRPRAHVYGVAGLAIAGGPRYGGASNMQWDVQLYVVLLVFDSRKPTLP